MFCVMLAKVAIISLHSINRLVFLMEALCVFCQVRSVSVCVMCVNLCLHGGRATAEAGGMVGRERWTGLSASSSILQSVSFDECARHIFILTLLLPEGQADEA
jgi:hypothetical protein